MVTKNTKCSPEGVTSFLPDAVHRTSLDLERTSTCLSYLFRNISNAIYKMHYIAVVVICSLFVTDAVL